MKLVRYGAAGQEKPGLIDKAGKLRDLSAQLKDISGDALSPASLAKIAALDPASLPAVEGSPRFGSPVGGSPKYIAIGLNYADHAAEAGMAIPSEPIVFMKANNSLCGPNDDVEKPRGSTKLDWEVELAIIIGTRAKYVTEADALKYVAGYAICNDVSERAFQIERMRSVDQGQVARHLRAARPLAPDVLAAFTDETGIDVEIARRRRHRHDGVQGGADRRQPRGRRDVRRRQHVPVAGRRRRRVRALRGGRARRRADGAAGAGARRRGHAGRLRGRVRQRRH